MTHDVVAEQEIAAHVFVPLERTPQGSGRSAMAEVWGRFRALQKADDQVLASLPTEFPEDLPPLPPLGSPVLAAVQSADGLDQAVLRRNQDVLNLSLLLGAAPARSWVDLQVRMERILGTGAQDLLSTVLLQLGKVQAGGPDSLTDVSPRADDSGSSRTLRMLVPVGHDGRLSAWSWSTAGEPEMPAFVRYLMYMSLLRYQLAVYSELRDGWATSASPQALIRVPFATAAGYRELRDPLDQLRAMQRSVTAAADNAERALDAWRVQHGPGPSRTDVLDDDRTLVGWFVQALEDDIAHAEMGERHPAPDWGSAPDDATAEPSDNSAERVMRSRTSGWPTPVTKDGRPVRVLAVCDEWFPFNGGLSTLNRLLCGALARAGADVMSLVVECDADERNDARDLGVRLIEARRLGHTGREALMRRPSLPEGWQPDLIIGHGRVTGPAARTQAEDHFPGTRRLQVLHVEPDQVEWHRQPVPEGDVGSVVDERTRLEVDLCRGAWRTAVIGPRLEAALVRQRRVPGFQNLGAPLRLDPGFDTGLVVQGAPPPDTVPRILVMGRLKDHHVKGLDIACQAVGRAVPEGSRPGRWQLTVRGTKDGRSGELYTQVTKWVAERAVDVNVLPYAADPREIAQDVAGSALVLMPSRAEAFGLVGLEAVTAGVPVLVSSRSGLGMLLDATLPRTEAERMVIDVDAFPDRVQQDIHRWSRHIGSVLFYPTASFERAAWVRKHMADRVPWSQAAATMLACLRDTAGNV
ncbi:CATRA conflict system CASPASE/TPR repeat-associated protein [Streptomyces sp. NPDC057403]|uniref:CATRA conflict system CASPASE/TPR repeat-associated protein n=1 Tax=Streptomyces sp. NPDC057403 TaxID=3346119 RepID=UPI0036AB5585